MVHRVLVVTAAAAAAAEVAVPAAAPATLMPRSMIWQLYLKGANRQVRHCSICYALSFATAFPN